MKSVPRLTLMDGENSRCPSFSVFPLLFGGGVKIIDNVPVFPETLVRRTVIGGDPVWHLFRSR